MDNPELISSIKEDLQKIGSVPNPETSRLLIQGINRQIKKLTGGKPNERLTRLGMDLMESYRSEMAMQRLSGRSKELSEGFFKSFRVLQADLLNALEQLSS